MTPIPPAGQEQPPVFHDGPLASPRPDHDAQPVSATSVTFTRRSLLVLGATVALSACRAHDTRSGADATCEAPRPLDRFGRPRHSGPPFIAQPVRLRRLARQRPAVHRARRPGHPERLKRPGVRFGLRLHRRAAAARGL